MQKLEGSNPSAASEKATFAGLFRGRSRLVRLRRDGPKPDPRLAGRTFGSKKVRGILDRSNSTSGDGDAEGHEFDR
jgi:hypothetical protein